MTPREELEARLTALLLGELSDEDASSFRQTIAQDKELSRLHDRLARTIALVRETVTSPEHELPTRADPPKLASARREKLLESFKVIRLQQLERAKSRKTFWRDWAALAAMVVVLGLLAGLLLPSFSSTKSKARASGKYFAKVADAEFFDALTPSWFKPARERGAMPPLAKGSGPTIDAVEASTAAPAPGGLDGSTLTVNQRGGQVPQGEGRRQLSGQPPAPTAPSSGSPRSGLGSLAGRQSFQSRLEQRVERKENMPPPANLPSGRSVQVRLSDTVGEQVSPSRKPAASSVSRSMERGSVTSGAHIELPELAESSTRSVSDLDRAQSTAVDFFTTPLTSPAIQPGQSAAGDRVIQDGVTTLAGGGSGRASGLGVLGGDSTPAKPSAPTPAPVEDDLALSPEIRVTGFTSLAREKGRSLIWAGGAGGPAPAMTPPPPTPPLAAEPAPTQEFQGNVTADGGGRAFGVVNPATPTPTYGNMATNSTSAAFKFAIAGSVTAGGEQNQNRLGDRFDAIAPEPALNQPQALTHPQDMDGDFVARFYRSVKGVADSTSPVDKNRPAEGEKLAQLSDGRANGVISQTAIGFTNVDLSKNAFEPTVTGGADIRNLPQGITLLANNSSAEREALAEQLVSDPATGLAFKSDAKDAKLGVESASQSGKRMAIALPQVRDEDALERLSKTAFNDVPLQLAIEVPLAAQVESLGRIEKPKSLTEIPPAQQFQSQSAPSVSGPRPAETDEKLAARKENSGIENLDKLAEAEKKELAGVKSKPGLRPAAEPSQVGSTEIAALSRQLVERQEVELRMKTPNPEKEDVNLPKPPAAAGIPQPEISAADNPFSTFSLNVSDVSFKLAAASLEKGVMPELASVRSEEFINAFDYRDPEPGGSAPIAFAWERARYPFAHDRDLLRFSIKTAALGRQPGRPLNLVLLLDNSGSMERADRVSIRQECLRVLAGQLQPQDRVSVVAFARTARLWVDGLPGSQAGELAQRLGGLTPDGGTNLEEAMNLAYQTALRHFLVNGVNRVVLLTDGAANLGDVNPDSLKKKIEAHRQQGVALDCFGIGWEGYNDDLLEVLSRNGDGRYGFVNTPEAASAEFAGQLAGALRVAASDVKVQVEFNPRRVTAYRQIGYAKHQLKKEQFRDNTVDAAEIGAAEAGNALYTVQVNPRGEGPLGTVRVRFKVPGTSDYREHEWPVPYTGMAKLLEESSPALRLAASAAAFSEWLVASPYAAEVTPDQLLAYLSGVPERCPADPRPKKLEWMIRQAKSISGK